MNNSILDDFHRHSTVSEEKDIPSTNVELGVAEFNFVKDIQFIMSEMLEVHLTESNIVNRILSSYSKETSYISLVNVTRRVKFSLTEVKRLSTFNKQEKRVLEYILLTDKRNPRINSLVDLIIRELKLKRGVLGEFESENIAVVELWNELEKEYNSKFQSWKLRGGVKKLIIKATIVTYILKRENAGYDF